MPEINIKNSELHRVTSTAIIYKPPRQNFSNGGKDRKYLIIQRSQNKKSFPGKWTVPGGGLEIDDYINTPKTTSEHWYFAVENSLRREIKEEVSLEVGELKYLLDIVFIRPDGTPVIILSYYCNYKLGKVKLNEENIDYKWISCKEAKKYDLIEGILEEIQMVDKILQTHPQPFSGKNNLKNLFLRRAGGI